MATLTVFRFETEGGAPQAANLIEKLQKQQLIQLHDAAIVTWPHGSKKPKTTHLSHMTGRGALDGAFWGVIRHDFLRALFRDGGRRSHGRAQR